MNHSGIAKKNVVHRNSNSCLIFVLGLILLSILSSPVVLAQGNLLITPRRVVFEGTKKTQELNLANTGQDTAKYNVSIVQYRMREDGSFEEITVPDPGQNFADKYIRFFPRSVSLGPNEAQVVKMQLTKTEQLAPGEYRSHVYFRSVPKETALGDERTVKDSTTLSVKLVPIFGITIPVIIRVGQSTMKVTISDLKLEVINDTIPRLQMILNRTGDMSVFGDIRVEHISPQGKTTLVGTVKGIAVYTPNPLRRFIMDLDKKARVNYHGGTLHVTFSAQADTRPEKYAEAELILH